MKQRLLHRNLFSCSGTALPPRLLLAAKLLAAYILLTGRFRDMSDHFLPFFSFFNYAGPPAVFRFLLQAVFGAACLAIFFNYTVRLASFTAGCVLMISLFSSRINYSSTLLFYSLVFIFIGLQDKERTPFFLRLQIVFVYGASALNKILEPDWRSGQFFEFFAGQVLKSPFFMKLSEILPPMTAGMVMCWTVIAAEGLLAAGFMLPRFRKKALILGIAFHLGMFVFSGGKLSIVFMYAMFCGYFAFTEWPGRPVTIMTAGGRFWKPWFSILKRTDPDGVYIDNAAQKEEKGLRICLAGREFSGPKAAVFLVRENVIFYWAPFGAMILWQLFVIPRL